MRGVAWICVAGAWLALGPGVAAGSGSLPRLPSATAGAEAPDRVLVRMRNGSAQAVAERHGGRVVRRLGALGWVEVAPRRSARSLVRALDADPAVAEAEVDHVREAYAVPDDLLYTAGINQRPYLNVIRMPQAWEITTGSDAMVTAVLDTGADLDHPDLASRLVPGVDTVDGDGVPADEHGHGTAVAGILGAATGNGEGIAGATWRGGVMPVRVLGADGTGSDSDIAAGIVAAVDRGARILNLSLGGPGDGAVLRDAVEYAVERGVLVVAAAGNESTDEPSYPAAYPGVLAVAATDWEGDTFWATNRGDWIDLAAPGASIAVTRLAAGPAHAYAAGDGTSFASPLVAGAAALVWAAHPGLPASAVAARLTASAADAGPAGIDPVYGHGLLDVAAAVRGDPRVTFRPPAGDPKEPNGTPASAAPLTDPYYTWATISPQTDVDWYSVELGGFAELEFQIESAWMSSNTERMLPEFQVFDPSLRALTPRMTRGHQGWVRVSAIAAGRYYLRVSNAYSGRSDFTPATHWGYVVKHTVTGSVPATPLGQQEWVRAAAPADFAAGVAASVHPSVTFVRALDPASIGAETAWLRDGRTGAKLAAAAGYDAGTRTLTLTPGAALPAGPYELRVDGVRDQSGVRMDEPFAVRFVVGPPAADTRPPDTTITFALFGGPAAEAGWEFIADEPGTRMATSWGVDPAFNATSSPLVYAMPGAGNQSIRFRAVDAAGNVDATPAARSWRSPPANDHFADAQVLSGPSGAIGGTTWQGGQEPGEPAHATSGGQISTWHRWTAPSSGQLDLDTFGSEFPAVVAVYTGGAVDGLTELGSSADWHGTGWGRVTIPVVAGQTYRIAIAGMQLTYPARGTYQLRWAFDTTTPNPTPTPTPTATATPTPTPTATPDPPPDGDADPVAPAGFSDPVTPAALTPTAPAATARPAISGRARVGRLLRATGARWSVPVEVRRAWLRCDRRGRRCRTVAEGRTYRLRRADAGHRLRVREIATDAGLSTRTVSAPTRRIRR